MDDKSHKERSEANGEAGEDCQLPKTDISADGAAGFAFCGRCGHVIIVTGRYVICPQCGCRCCPSCSE